MINRRQFHTRSLALLGTAAAPWAAQAAMRPPGPGGFPAQTIIRRPRQPRACSSSSGRCR